jgi:hypothetical protein
MKGTIKSYHVVLGILATAVLPYDVRKLHVSRRSQTLEGEKSVACAFVRDGLCSSMVERTS